MPFFLIVSNFFEGEVVPDILLHKVCYSFSSLLSYLKVQVLWQIFFSILNAGLNTGWHFRCDHIGKHKICMCSTFKMQDSCLTITCSFCSNNAPWARSVLRFLFSRAHYRSIYTSDRRFSVQQSKFLCCGAYGTWEWAGKGKRGPKSSGNGNMEESLSCLFPPSEQRWKLGLVFPDASHSYCS